MSDQLVQIGGHGRGFGATTRADNWWIGPTLTFLGLSAFIVYASWAGMQGAYYWADPYLSPMYAPLLFVDPSAPGSAPLDHAWFGEFPSWWYALDGVLPGLPKRALTTPAALILIFPAAFRLTCYYYRKAYYRAFALTPPACAVQGIREGKYRGETHLLLFQNLHRYALYFALVFIVILAYDALVSFFKDGQFGIGVGSIVQTINAILLAGYTFGCHSLRHLIGGRKNWMTCDGGKASTHHRLWLGCSRLNGKHMLWAWLSLFWVGFTDFYIRMVSMGVITDLNTWD
ncbi:MAG: succinate dehydrogenase [Deltaproteobacteria bacterium]|nr:MAG: succinate dehydrogenase [Deltaproteobacteria bacterium]